MLETGEVRGWQDEVLEKQGGGPGNDHEIADCGIVHTEAWYREKDEG
jgi:hypothetical protein